MRRGSNIRPSPDFLLMRLVETSPFLEYFSVTLQGLCDTSEVSLCEVITVFVEIRYPGTYVGDSRIHPEHLRYLSRTIVLTLGPNMCIGIFLKKRIPYERHKRGASTPKHPVSSLLRTRFVTCMRVSTHDWLSCGAP